MNLVSDYAAEGISFRRSVRLLGIPRSSFYSRPVVSPKSGGRKPSSFTARINSSTVRHCSKHGACPGNTEDAVYGVRVLWIQENDVPPSPARVHGEREEGEEADV